MILFPVMRNCPLLQFIWTNVYVDFLPWKMAASELIQLLFRINVQVNSTTTISQFIKNTQRWTRIAPESTVLPPNLSHCVSLFREANPLYRQREKRTHHSHKIFPFTTDLVLLTMLLNLVNLCSHYIILHA